jgi:steroid delta-isomerase-like uncharacterized protein
MQWRKHGRSLRIGRPPSTEPTSTARSSTWPRRWSARTRVATTHGPAELRALFDVFWTALPDFKHEFSQVLEDDAIVAIEGIASGTHQGPLASPTGEIPPTGRSVTFPFAAWARVENGKIVRFHGYWDVAGFMQQIGAAQEPAEAAV